MHDIEREIIKVSNFIARKKYTDRQEYLKAILNSLEKLSDDDFDNLSDEATAWSNAAVQAYNSRDEDLPEFDEVAPTDEEDSDDSNTDDGAEANNDPDGPDNVADDEVAAEGPDEEVEEKPAPKAAKKAKAKKPEKPEKVEVFPPSKTNVKAQPVKAVKHPKIPDDVEMDKWGCMEGSKNSQALALFEKGATTKEVKDKIGGTYYNILGKCVEHGHKLEKEGSLMKLIHKDDLGGKKPAVKKGKSK